MTPIYDNLSLTIRTGQVEIKNVKPVRQGKRKIISYHFQKALLGLQLLEEATDSEGTHVFRVYTLEPSQIHYTKKRKIKAVNFPWGKNKAVTAIIPFKNYEK